MSERASERSPGAVLSFPLLGFPVRVRMEFLIVSALLGSGAGDARGIASWVGVVFVSVLFHELGHAVVARVVGYEAWIELYGMCGLTHYQCREDAPPTFQPSWRSDLAISVAGPCFGLALGGAIWLAARFFPQLSQHEVAHEIVRDLLWANIGWSLINLLPILPYDGGLAARAILGRLFPRRGARMAQWLSVVVGGMALALSLYIRSVWTGYLALRALLGAFRALRFDAALRKAWDQWDLLAFPAARADAERAAGRAIDVTGTARALELIVFSCLAAKDAVGAKAAFSMYPTGVVPSPILRAIVALDTDEPALAAELLRTVPPALSIRVLLPILVSWGKSGWEDRAMTWLDERVFPALSTEVTGALGEALFLHGCFALSVRVHELRFGASRSPFDAYNVACSLARGGRGEAALGWLERALDAGWTDVATLDGDDDLRTVRCLEGYAALRSRIASAT